LKFDRRGQTFNALRKVFEGLRVRACDGRGSSENYL
jgi:hypothetical protein